MIHIHIASTQSDRHVAAALSRKLQRFNRKNDLPETVIDEALFSSEPDAQNFLIIVCSPEAVHDEAMAQAIRLFHEKSSATQIISHIHKGIPNAKEPNKDCLPTVLAELKLNDLLASNPLQTGRRIAFHKLVSTIYNIPLDQLEQRSKRQRTRRTITIVCALVVFAAILILDYLNTHTVAFYCRSFHYENGVPVGEGWLGPWPQIFADDYYELGFSDWHVTSLTAVGDPAGCTASTPAVQAYYDAIDAHSITFIYQQNGQLDTALHYDESGYLLFLINYIGGISAADLTTPDSDGYELPYYLTFDGVQGEFSRCIFQYDRQGRVTDIQYYRNSRNEN